MKDTSYFYLFTYDILFAFLHALNFKVTKEIDLHLHIYLAFKIL